jgi:hypothetical protein
MTRDKTFETAGTSALVRAYVRSWTHRDFEAGAGRPADDLEVAVDMDASPTKASFTEALTECGTATLRAAAFRCT